MSHSLIISAINIDRGHLFDQSSASARSDAAEPEHLYELDHGTQTRVKHLTREISNICRYFQRPPGRRGQ